uniref:Uncharacterized protein n=1 Tax=Ailuropoda melanoleuca TaxID=9646 RepID=A0A7N5KCB2_AILME
MIPPKRKRHRFRGARSQRAQPQSGKPSTGSCARFWWPRRPLEASASPGGTVAGRAGKPAWAAEAAGSSPQSWRLEAGSCVRGRTRSRGSEQAGSLPCFLPTQAPALEKPLPDQAQHFANSAPFSEGTDHALGSRRDTGSACWGRTRGRTQARPLLYYFL